MNRIWVFTIMGLFLIPVFISSSNALQQVAGQIVVQANPGETKTFQWGLADDTSQMITVSLSASGNGSEFLSFPKTVDIQPNQMLYVNVNATIPADYQGGVTLSPSIYAIQQGSSGGPTVLNIQMQKILTLQIAPNQNTQAPNTSSAVPEFSFLSTAILSASLITAVLFSTLIRKYSRLSF